MNRINQLFQDSPKNLLSIYFCAGCPNLDGTADVIRALERNGVSMIEIGIPFSDPMADGIVIQNAATRALHNGMSLRLLFEQLRDIRRDVRIPLVLMGYLNPIMQFGFEAFCQKCVECGIDGVIIPDLPFRDYEESYKAIASKYDIRVIMLITPETSEARVREIDAHTDGFIYLVSSAATTGAQKDFDTRKQAYFKKIEDMNLRNPRMVGFGISNKQTFDAACAHSSGAIIGSRFVTLLNEKPLDKITVTDLTEHCGVNRMTFYYHFKDIYDLVEWACIESATRALAGQKTYDTWQQGFLQILQAVQKDKVFVTKVYHSISREHIENYLYRLTYDLMIGVVEEKAAGMTVRPEDKEFIANFYKYAFVGLTLEWVRTGMKDDPAALIERVSTLIHGDITKALEACRIDK